MDLLDILNEINERIYKETGDIRAEIFILRNKLNKFEEELSDLFVEIIQENDQDKIEKIHDYYAQIYLESENFMKELKGEKDD